MILETEYGFGEIPANTVNLRFTFTLRPQPAVIREIHAVGSPSTNFSISIFDRENYDPISRVYQRLNINLELHDYPWPHPIVMNNERRYIYFIIDNNDTVNPCRLRVRLVYEPI